MREAEMKYVRTFQDEVIMFPPTIIHSSFAHRKIKSAGFCVVEEDKVRCYGESISLGLKSDKEDNFLATLAVYGSEKALKLEGE